MLNLDFTEEQDMLRDMVRGLCAELSPLSRVRELEDDPDGVARELWERFGELGLCGLMVPESIGGSGMNLIDGVVLYEELGRSLAPLPHFVSCVMAAGAIAEAGSVAQREELLSGIATGEAVATVAWLEPGGGFKPQGVQLRAQKDGDSYILDGSKTHVAFAAAADLLVVLARTGDTERNNDTDPTGHTNPTGHTEHVGHADPTGHTNPTGHTEHVGHADPTSNADPTGHTEHVGHADPTSNADPTGHTNPTGHTEHVGHADPTSNADPTGHTERNDDADPTGDTEPTNHTERNDDADPTGDTEPTNHTERNDDAERGIELFVVPTKSPGLRLEQRMSIAADTQYLAVFDQVRVPVDARLGDPATAGSCAEGWQAWERAMHAGAVLAAAQAVGGAAHALEITVEYAKARHQFGKALAEFQAISHYLADARTELDGARLLVCEAGWAHSTGRSTQALAPMAKLFACRTYRNITAMCQQVFGGIGFTVDYDIQLYFRRAKQLQVSWWDQAACEDRIANAVLSLS